MKEMKFIIGFIATTIFNVVSSQIYVGEILTHDGYQYLKLELKNDSTFISLPYELRQTFKYALTPKVNKTITVKARSEKREFTFSKINLDHIELQTNFTGRSQSIKLVRQLEPIEKNLSGYTGNFIDKNGNRAIIYVRNGYLHLMSPYTEETVSLKPVGKNKFWNTSGETTVFSQDVGTVFNSISISNRFGQVVELNRSHDYKVEEDWVMVDNDSIYVNIFIPAIEGKKPACLLLPGGGGQSQMENFEFEARLFASHGLIAMTFDKESVGKSKGQSFENYTFKEKALRYQQLFQYLQSHPEVASKKVGIHGPSEGGRLALTMGINLGSKVAFINATAAPIMTMTEGQLFATNNYSRNLGMSEEDIASTLTIWKNYYAGVINEKIDTTDFKRIRELQEKYQRAFLPPTSDILPLSPKKEDLIDNFVVSKAREIVSPVFLQYGENDERVDPMRSLQNFYQNISDNLDVTAELYRRGNHSMMTPEYQICIGYSYDKIKWLKSIGIIK